MNQKPEFADSDLARWKEALSSGSAIRFEQGSATLVVHTLEELEAYLQLDPGAITPTKENSQHETSTFRLDPGSAVLRTDGLLPALIEGSQSGPLWCLPGDFKLYHQSEYESDQPTGKWRDILVGPMREIGDDEPLIEGTAGAFFTVDELLAEFGDDRKRVFELQQLIGELPEGAHPDEIKPRAASFMAERANWETEVAALRASESELRTALADLTARNAELLTAGVVSASGLPADARERLVAIKGISEKLADEIVAALSSSTTD